MSFDGDLEEAKNSRSSRLHPRIRVELKKPVHVSSITYGEDLQVTKANIVVGIYWHAAMTNHRDY